MKKLSLVLVFVCIMLAWSPSILNPPPNTKTTKPLPAEQPTTSQGSSMTELNWTLGWSPSTISFNAFPASRLVYRLTNNETTLELQYVLNRTNEPNTTHTVAIDLYWPSVSSCIPTFGSITGGTGSSGSSPYLGILSSSIMTPPFCRVDTAQGVTRVDQGFKVGELALDNAGSGFLNVTISNVPSGTFQAEFDVRGGICPQVDCSVILQSPGPTFGAPGSTVFISTVTATSILAVGPPLTVPIGIALSKDGQQLFVSDYGANAVFAIPSRGGSPKLLASGGPLVGTRGMAISPDGSTLYIAGFGTDTIVSLPSAGGTPTVIASGAPFSNPHGIAVSPDGSTLYVADNVVGAVFSLPAAGGSPTTLASGPPFGTQNAGPNDLKVSPDGSTLFINSGPAGIFTLPTKGGTPTLIGTFPGLSQPFGVSLSSDGKKLYFLSIDNAFSGLPTQILMMPASGGEAVPLLSGPPIVHGAFMTISHDNQVLYLADNGGLSNIPSEPGRVLSLTLPTSCCNPPTGLVSWWPGEGNANDIVGNNNGRLVNGVSFAPGVVGQAFSFNGTNQYVDLGNSSSLQVSHGDFTVDAWVSFNTTSGDMSILDKMSGTGSNQDGWRLLKQSDNKFWFCFGGGSLGNGCGGGPPTIVTSMTTVSTGVWYNIVAVKALSTISIYMDGNLEGTAGLGPFIDTNSTNLIIGATHTQGLIAFLNGLVDEPEVYNRALTASEIQTIFHAGSFGMCNCKNQVNSEWNANTDQFPNEASPAWRLVNTATPLNPVLSAGKLVINTTDPVSNMYYVQSANISFPFHTVIEARLRLVSGTSLNPARAPADIGFFTAPFVGNDFFIGQGEVFLLSGDLTRGQTATVDTQSAFHNYTIIIDNGTKIQVLQDNVPILSGSTFTSTNQPSTPEILFGEASTAAAGTSEWEFVRHNAGPSVCRCIPSPQGLESWWPGDGNANDVIGNHNGLLVNGATFGPGEVQQAFSFNGVNQFANVTNDPAWNFGSNPFSIDLWVNFNQAPGHDAFVSHDEGPNNQNKWFFGLNPFSTDTGLLVFHINGPTIGPISIITAPWTPSPGQWYHIAVTRNAAIYALYIDGRQVATASNTTPIPDAAALLAIGMAEGSFFHNGLIDEVQIFNSALSSSEVQAIYNAGGAGQCRCVTPPAGLVSWWPLDGNANDIQDGNSGRVVGTGGQFVPGEVGQGFQSGGPGSLILVNDTTNLTPGSFTIDAWVKVNALTSSDMPIVWKGNSIGADVTSSYSLEIFGNPGSLIFPPGSIISGTPGVGKAFLTIDNGTFDQVLISNSPIPIGTFVHYAASINGSRIRLYVNGQLDVEANQIMTPAHSPFPFQIGGANGTSTPGFFFNGVIDELDLYNRALTPSEIQSIFNAGSAGKCKPTATWTQLSPSVSPPARFAASMAYDAADGYVLLFGGYNHTSFLGDTWEFKAGTWTQLFPSLSPPPRYYASMSYDAADNYVLLFGGGNSGGLLSDTWEFKAGSWSQLSPSISPSPRITASMAYDPADGYVLLFGGTSVGRVDVSDTWEFKAGSWTQLSLSTSPSPRDTAPMAYDAADGHLILFGGYNLVNFLGDTWEFNAGAWTQLSPAISPSPRETSSMVYDATDAHILLFGEVNTTEAGFTILGDTWKFQSGSWTQLFPSISPSPRASSSMAFDGADGYVLLFGGEDIIAGTSFQGDTWKFGPITTVPTKATPTISSAVTPSSITIGGSASDLATVSGGSSPTGTLTYTAYSDSACTTLVFTSASIPLGTHSGVFTPSTAGTYLWIASYSGDANNNAVSTACGATGETLTVSKATPTITTTLSPATITVGSSLTDSSTLAGFFKAGGSVTYNVYASGTTCTGVPIVFTETVPVTNGIVPNSRSVVFNNTGSAQWQVVYSGDANNNPATSICGTESLTVIKSTTTTATALSSSSIIVGTSASDSASISSFFGGFSTGGSVDFNVYSGTDCTGTAVFSETVTVNPATGAVPGSRAVQFNSTGIYEWQAVYSGDGNNQGSASLCGSEPLTVNKASPAITSTVTPAAITLGGSASDLASLTGGFSPSGTVTYKAYSDSACTTAFFTSASIPLGTHSGVFTPSTAGTYRWIASYSGDANNNAVATTCGATAETLTVANVAPSVSTVSCGHDLSCSVLSNATLTKVKFAGITIHAEANGLKGAHGYANITVPRTAIPNIDNLHVFVDNSKLARSDVTITSNSTDYFIYFTFTFHSPVQIDIQLTAPENAPSLILGLDPTLFYEIVGALVAVFVVIVALAVMATRRRSRASNISRQR